jgi:hypothetical protein
MSPEAAARQKIDDYFVAAGRSIPVPPAASPSAKSRSIPAAAIT